MTRYRFPDVLGGGEHEGTREGETIGFNLPDLFGHLWLHQTDVTELPPPIPAEPSAAADALSYYVDRYGMGWQNSIHRKGWWATGGQNRSWAALWAEAGPLVRLVPALPEVELPWAGTSLSERGIELAQDGLNYKGVPVLRLAVDGESVVAVGPDTAERLGYALISAARAARSKT